MMTMMMMVMVIWDAPFWVVGIWLRVDPNVSKYVLQLSEINVIFTLAYVLMAIGVFVMIIGFLGCCGAIRGEPVHAGNVFECLLVGVFFILLFIIFAILLGFGIFAVVVKDSLKDEVREMLKRGVDKYDANNPETTDVMDAIQTNFHCCGADGSMDYEKTKNVPDSCQPEYRSVGCADGFFEYIAEHLIIVAAGVAIALAIVLILGMIFSMVLCCALRDQV
nr:hypothetical protein BaRGS_001474 [Batillaria attramentaria]